eukprot:TRINITY_DN2050_c0_g1_i2.p1 TRINITY_DN2050_c0_g1~~TRINITY_DN2050_c0_g1_i2.p1  ORF type:complete len:248 (-),score=26.81 TRINITY_DN2050_c0_g1_i2:120-836(-)
MFYNNLWALKGAHMGSAPAPAPNTYQSPKKKSVCCTKIQILEALLFVSTITHILVLSIGCSIVLNPGREYIEFGGYQFYSSQTGPDLVTVGIIGAAFSILGIIGIWKATRGLLIPLMFYLCVFLLVDLVSFVACFFRYTWDSDDLYEDLRNLEVIRLGGHGEVDMLSAEEPDISMFMICLLMKIFGNIIFLKMLLDVYRKNLKLRASRSPLRNVGKPAETKFEENETPVKPGKYTQIV